MKKSALIVLMTVFCGVPGGVVCAQEESAGDASSEAASDWRSDLVETTRAVEIGGVMVRYRATAGTMPLEDDDGARRADVFFVAYTRLGVEDPSERPVAFAFNGGPGSSSVWLHMGALGPYRAEMGPDGEVPRPPGRAVPNEHSWLDVADLVFIDPVSTGFSRPAEGERAGAFHGLRQDIESVGDFIRVWTTRYERWSSPKFLAGESYGTTRAAGLAGYLQERHGMYLNGIVLISPVLNFQTVRFNLGNDDPCRLFLPTYAATAWKHGKLSDAMQARSLEEVVDEARTFAQGDYLVALAAGDRLSDDERARIARRIAELTGLSADFVERTNLRIAIWNFAKELLRDERKVVGRLDSRYTALEREHVGDSYERDPSYSAILGPYTAALNDYVRRTLEYENDTPYEILTGKVRPWDYGSHENEYVDVSDTLRGAISQNEHLHVLVACGYYDLATPFFAAEQTVAQMQLPREHRENVTFTYYPSGHMMYVREADLEKLKADWVGFVEKALK